MPPIATFESWYRREHPRVVASLMTITGDRALAAEATDEAFVRAFERWGRVSVMSSPSGWVYQTALNLLRRRYRRRALEARATRRSSSASEREARPVDWSPEVWDALGRLPRRERTAVVLFHVADLPMAAIAVAMGVAPGTVGSSLHAGRARLAKELAEAVEVHDG